jgi:hypothetical protein
MPDLWRILPWVMSFDFPCLMTAKKENRDEECVWVVRAVRFLQDCGGRFFDVRSVEYVSAIRKKVLILLFLCSLKGPSPPPTFNRFPLLHAMQVYVPLYETLVV